MSDARPAPQPARPLAAPLPGPLPGPLPAPLPSAPPPPERPGAVRYASVPKILLGLGALCLLVAAVVFLAVSWAALGVGGRTAVLVGLTLAAGTAALLLHRFGLRIAGEALSVVTLGLLALDVLGADAAGWLGDASRGVAVSAAGAVVAVAGVALGSVRLVGRPRLVAPQVAVGVGLLIGHLGAVTATDHRLVAGHVVTALAIGAATLGARRGRPALLWSAAAAAALIWLGTTVGALVATAMGPDLHRLWVQGTGWSMLTSAAALLAPGLLARHRGLLLGGLSGAGLLATVALTVPCVDAGLRTIGVVALGATTAWTLVAGVLARRARIVAAAPAATGCLVLSALVLRAVADVLDRWERVSGVFDHPWDTALAAPAPVTEPLLVVPSLLVVLGCAALVAPARTRRTSARWWRAAALVAGIAATVTVASYDVPLLVPLGMLAVVAGAAAAPALVLTGAEGASWAVICVTATGTVALAALPSAGATLATLTPLAVVLGGLTVVGAPACRVVAGGCVPAALGLVTAAAVMVAGGDAAWVSIPVLLVVGVLAAALPRLEVEIPAAGVALVALPVSAVTTDDLAGFLALWLAVAGFVLSATALLHPSRRPAAFAGAALLLLASWVRLGDLGVTEPEPYTLPLAAALLAVGLWRLQRSPSAGTTEALLPGLLLATVPSLLWVLGEPVSPRALLLGGACLGLTLAGALARWSAPLVVGAGVGAVVVVRELGPYAGVVPQWVWIGLAGALLTIVGITWERRLRDVRRAADLLGRLR